MSNDNNDETAEPDWQGLRDKLSIDKRLVTAAMAELVSLEIDPSSAIGNALAQGFCAMDLLDAIAEAQLE